MRKKTSKGSSPATFQLDIESIFSRRSDSSLKEYDFSSNHTEDKSLFEAILNDDGYSLEQPLHTQKHLPRKYKKKMDSIEKVVPSQQQPSQDARKNKRCTKPTLDALEVREDPAPPEQFFSQFLNKKHQSEILMNGELSEEEEQIVKAPQVESPAPRLKEMLPRKSKKKIIYKQVRQRRCRNLPSQQTIELFSNVPVEKPGSYTNDDFDQYLNL